MEKIMFSKKAKDELKRQAGITEDVDCRLTRTSKWGVRVDFVKGLCMHASFQFNCRTRSCKRLV